MQDMYLLQGEAFFIITLSNYHIKNYIAFDSM